jgi:DNA-binding transcriptional regulator YdaS (Cro superfamily)
MRARRLVKRRGEQSRLSRHLGVPRQRLNEWLHGKRLPGGEHALMLLQWVEEQGKTNGLAGALTPARQETRSRKSNHEKPETSPP